MRFLVLEEMKGTNKSVKIWNLDAFNALRIPEEATKTEALAQQIFSQADESPVTFIFLFRLYCFDIDKRNSLAVG